MEKQVYHCPKCGCTSFEHDQFQATGGTMAKLFDIQNKKFITVSCTNCGFTELYRSETPPAKMCWFSDQRLSFG